MKARLIYASGDFAESFQSLFHRLIFLTPFHEQLGSEIHHLRIRMEQELAKEAPAVGISKRAVAGLKISGEI